MRDMTEQVNEIEKVQAQSAGAFQDFESEKVSTLPFQQLPTGWHVVVVQMCIFTNDFMTGLRDPQMKAAENLPVWKDPTIQLAVYFEGEHHNGATRRFSRYGYWTYDDMLVANAEEAAKCEKQGEQGYAVYKEDGIRAISPDKTQKASLILNRFLSAAGIPEGTKGSDLPALLIGKELKVLVAKKIYNEKEMFEITSFADATAPDAELSRVPVPRGYTVDAMPAVADEPEAES